MKKALTITLACVLAAGVLGGCSGKGGENMTEGVTGGNSEAVSTEAGKEEKAQSAASGEKTVIHYYDWVTMDSSIIDEFNAANPDIEVQYHAIPDNGSDKLTPVSYTHLDVYKRQMLYSMGVSLMSSPSTVTSLLSSLIARPPHLYT